MIGRRAAQHNTHRDHGPDGLRFDVETFSAERRAIAQAVKAALPDWTAVYHDEAAWRQACEACGGAHERIPQEVFEHPVPPARSASEEPDDG